MTDSNSSPVPFVLVLVMAGSGRRFGGPEPKAFVRLGELPLWRHSIATFTRLEGCLGAVLVVPPDRIEQVAADASGVLALPFAVVAGGERRQDSVRAGLEALEDVLEGGDHATVVAIHDAARPLIRAATAAEAIRVAAHTGASLAAVPARDTIKRVDEDGYVLETPDRAGLWQAQTPQCFRIDLIRRAHEVSAERGVAVTDDASMVEALGMPVQVVRADAWNLKITEPADLTIAAALLAAGREVLS